MKAGRLVTVALILVVIGALAGSSVGGPSVPTSTEAQKPAAAVLDGVYRLDFDLTQQLRNGIVQAGQPFSLRYAFRSTCDEDECVAVGRMLKSDDPTQPGGGVVATMDYVKGEWVRTNGGEASCGAKRAPVLQSWSLRPGLDGRLTGVRRLAFFGGDCIGAYEQPMSAVRVGEVDSGVMTPDPAKEPALKTAAAEGFHGRYDTSTTGKDGRSAPNVQVAVTTTCVRNLDQCLTYVTYLPPAGGTRSTRAYQFQGKTWTGEVNSMGKCPNGRDATVTTRFEWMLPDPVSDPFPRVTGTQSEVYLQPCVKTVDSDVLMVRIGD